MVSDISNTSYDGILRIDMSEGIFLISYTNDIVSNIIVSDVNAAPSDDA